MQELLKHVLDEEHRNQHIDGSPRGFPFSLFFEYPVFPGTAIFLTGVAGEARELDDAKTHGVVLACTDGAVLPINEVFYVIKELGNEGLEQCDPLLLTSASLLSNSPAPLIAFVYGTILICKSSQSDVGSFDKIKAKNPSWKIGSSFAIKVVIVKLKIAHVGGLKKRKKYWGWD
ncbi:hypothetical protein VNO78_23470 [Psophocarpus tetragonolobus]|uniref:Uncharacterized protein n=1 Tax=Psophocarpus tetragonolobus TaxID=3891 RepID=A0AAN9XDK0_PSOTE